MRQLAGNKVWFLALLLALLCACSDSVPQRDPGDDTALQSRETFELYVDSINRGDMDAAAAFYDGSSGDFHWIERGAVQYDNGAAAADALKELSAAGGQPRMEVDELHVTTLSDTSALVSAHFTFAMLDDAGAEGFSFDGWMSVAMVKRGDGWKIAAGQTGPGKSAAEYGAMEALGETAGE